MDHGRLIGLATSITSLVSLLFAVSANAKQFPAVAGEYVLKVKSTTSLMSTHNLASALGVTIKHAINKEEKLFLVQRPVVETRENAIQTLSANALVEYVEPNYIYKVLGGAEALPNDPDLARLWGMNNTGDTYSGDGGDIKGRVGMDINAVKAWQVETGSHDVIVAVIDTGVNYNNPELMPNIYVNQAEANGKTGVDDDNNGYVDDIHGYDFAASDADPMDVYGHGTHCSGTIGAAGNNAQGITGVAWNVQIMPVRFLDDSGGGTLENAVLAIDYATKMHANIMSNSWGGGGFSQAMLDSIQRAKDANILFIAAAGNDGSDNDATPSYPAGYQLDNVVSVAAVDPSGAMADFSNFGATTVHIAAPGVNVVSYTMKGLESWSGTSMATPHVSGVATLLLSQDMTQSYATIKSRLLAGARPMGSLRGRVATGMLDAYNSLTNTVAPADPQDPYNWQKDDSQNVSTAHPYADKFTQSWTFKVDGAKQVSVYFSKFETEANYDKVVFKNAAGEVVGTISGNRGATFGPAVDGDTVTMEFTSDSSNGMYGFDVGGIAYQ